MHNWRKASWYRDSLVGLICIALVITPYAGLMPVAYADEVIDEANKGQDTGANLLLNYQVPSINNGPPLDPLGANEINVQELFPGFDPGDPSQLTPFTDLNADPADLSTQGVAQQFTRQAGTGNEAEAYQGLVDGSNNPHNATIDMRTDTFLDRSREIISGTDPILDELLTACAEDVTAGDPGTDTVTRLEDIYTCSQLRTGLSGSCTVERDFILLPVATQVVLAVAGGVCTESPAGSGNDVSDWSIIHGGLMGAGGASPSQYCQSINALTGDWYFRNVTAAFPVLAMDHYFGKFCGEFDLQVPTPGQCSATAGQLEHACRNSDTSGGLGVGFHINLGHPTAGPAGSCSGYAPGLPTSFDGSIPVDYTGCDQDRIDYCASLNTEFTAECTNDAGTTCPTCTPGASGMDQSDWGTTSPQPAQFGYPPASTGPAEACYSNSPFSDAEWYYSVYQPGPPANRIWVYGGRFCGEFDTAVPTAGQCNATADVIELECRNAQVPVGTVPWITSDPYNIINPAHSSAGPAGSCTAPTAGFPVDYSACDADRQSYCTQMRTEFITECNRDPGTCPSCGSGLDITEWGDPALPLNLRWNAFDPLGSGALACQQFNNPPPGDEPPEYYRNGPIGLIYQALSAKFCGEFDTLAPSAAACQVTALWHEHTCRGTVGLFELNPARGPTGSCTGPEPGPVDWSAPVDYSLCDADRQTYCEAVAAEYTSECSGTCGGTCEAEDNISLYNFLSYFNNDGPVHACRTNRQFFDISAPPLSILEGFSARTFSFGSRTILDPGDWEVRGTSTDACGSSPGGDCSVQGTSFYNNCIAPTGSGLTVKLYAGGTPPDIPAFCAAEQAIFEANCNAANLCLGGGPPSAALLNGTETITSPGLGPGFLEILADQNVFGTTVDFEETAFNPGDYGLAAGEYVIADHTVTGDGIDSSNIDDGGSYGSNWDFTTTLTLTDSTGFNVEATLYEIVANGFIFTGCSQADVQNVDSGVCSGSITCTDYTPPCRIVDGVLLCESPSYTYGVTEVLTPWSDFTSAVPEMCWYADVNIEDCVGQTNCIGNPACVADCDDLPPELQPACLADACWVDAQGDTICLDDTSETWVDTLGDVNYTDDCGSLIDDPACTLLPQISCIEGMEDPADPTNIDACLLRQRFFDCGSDVTVPGVPGADDVDITCGAQIRCLGEECANTESESNPDFVKAAVATTTLTESTKDMTCDIAGDPSTCKIFEGNDSRCKDPRGSYLGIIPDCCKQAREAAMSAGDFALYMKLALWTFKLARDPVVGSWLAQNQVLPSALQKVVNTPGQITRSVGRVITSGFNSALEWANLTPVQIATDTSGLQGAVAASPTGFGPLQQFIATGFYEFLEAIGAEQLAASLFTTTAEGTVTDWAADGLGEMVGNVFGTIMFIYTVYSIVKILGAILFACEEEELAFGIQLVNRACHHVGTYCSKKISFLGFKKCVIETQTHCCFSSPFARIINEQLRDQGIGPDWGTATEPNCDGIAITELESVDWSLVDLSEWEAILFEAGLVPDPRNPPLNFVPTEYHPGDAAGGPEGATATEIMTDTLDLVIPEFGEARFDLEGQPMNQPDPDMMPWYDDGVP